VPETPHDTPIDGLTELTEVSVQEPEGVLDGVESVSASDSEEWEDVL
jgi:hypothetical protein